VEQSQKRNTIQDVQHALKNSLVASSVHRTEQKRKLMKKTNKGTDEQKIKKKQSTSQGSKNPGFFWKNQPGGFLGFYWVFAGFFLFQCAVLDNKIFSY